MTRGIGLVFIDYFEHGAMPSAATPSRPVQHEA